MAIGSAPEIGERFRTGIWTLEEARAWRSEVGPDLLGGYAKLCFPHKRHVNKFPLVPFVDTAVTEH